MIFSVYRRIIPLPLQVYLKWKLVKLDIFRIYTIVYSLLCCDFHAISLACKTFSMVCSFINSIKPFDPNTAQLLFSSMPELQNYTEERGEVMDLSSSNMTFLIRKFFLPMTITVNAWTNVRSLGFMLQMKDLRW